VVLYITSKEVHILRNVNFYEYVFPYEKNSNCNIKLVEENDVFDSSFELTFPNEVNNISDEQDTHTYDEAIKSFAWCEVMKKKLHTLDQKQTWCITNLPKKKKPIRCKWV